MNTVLYSKGIYSCAINSHPVLNEDLNCQFVTTLKEAGRSFGKGLALNIPNKLILTRIPVWNDVKNKCLSLKRMYYNPQFSQLFNSSSFE